MGAREDLLRAAKVCLDAKSHIEITARDIVAVAGSSLASINYHFPSKEALIEQALAGVLKDWTAQLSAVLAADHPSGMAPTERFEATWNEIFDLIDEHRDFWSANLDMLARGALLGAQAYGSVAPDGPLVKVYQALMIGVMAQRLTDPRSAPTGRELATAVRTLLDAFE